MRKVAEGVYVAGSRYWQLNTGVVVAGGRAIVVDAGVFPDELAALAAKLRGLGIVAGISTHEDWDHVLWSSELGASVPRLASTIAARVAGEDRARLLADVTVEQDAHGVRWEHDLVARLQPVPFGPVPEGPVPVGPVPVVGRRVVGPAVELCDLAGHTRGHAGVWVPDGRVAFVGDTLSDVDPPVLPGSAAGVRQYTDSLDRLQGLIGAADVVVPGHGQVCDRDEARRRLAADRHYLDVIARGAGARPDAAAYDLGRHTASILGDPRLESTTGWRIHLDNLMVLLAGAATDPVDT